MTLEQRIEREAAKFYFEMDDVADKFIFRGLYKEWFGLFPESIFPNGVND